MEHEEAIETKAAERYALGELDEMDRDAFEEHFFDCPECAESVRVGASLMDGGRAVVRETPNVVPFRRPARRAPLWLSTAAAAAAIVVVGYQNAVTIPALVAERDAARTPRVAAPVFLVTNARAEAAPEPPVVSAPRGGMGSISFDITDPQPAAQYVAEVRDASGVRLALPVSSEQAKETVELLLPAGSWPAGRYELAIVAVRDGGRRAVIQSFPFVVRVVA